MTTTLTREPAATVNKSTALPPAAPRRLTTLTTTLRGHRNCGDLAALAASLAGDGLRQPVTLNPAGQVIIGLRRALAARIAGLDIIPCRTVTTVAQALEVTVAERAADHSRPPAAVLAEPPTIGALLELDDAIRSLQWWIRGAGGDAMDHRHALAGVAAGLDGTPFWNSSQYSHGRALYLASQGLRANSGGSGQIRIPPPLKQAAAQAVAQLGHRDVPQITTLYRLWRDGHPVTPPAPVLFTHRDVPGLVASLQGFTAAVTRTGAPAGDLTPDDIAALDTALTGLVRRLTALRRGIRNS